VSGNPSAFCELSDSLALSGVGQLRSRGSASPVLLAVVQAHVAEVLRAGRPRRAAVQLRLGLGADIRSSPRRGAVRALVGEPHFRREMKPALVYSTAGPRAVSRSSVHPTANR